MAEQLNEVERSKIIGKKQLRELVNVSYSTWYRMEKSGCAPVRVKLSAGRVGWRLGDVMDWLSNRSSI